MSYKAVIFDLDGTLIDSLRDIAESMNRSLASMGHPTHKIDSYRYFVGDGIRQLANRALPETHRNDDQIDRFLAGYQNDYFENWNIHTRPYKGITGMLSRLMDADIPMSILSNKPDGMTRECTEHFFPKTEFKVIAGQKSNVPRKPDPTAALQIAEEMDVDPVDCAFVGDTATDMKTAVAAGMFPTAVTWGFREEDELFENGARLIAHKPEALNGLFQ